MTMPPVRSASASPSADLPLAVGPAMMARGGRALGIATLIAAERLERGSLSAATDALSANGLRNRAPAWLEAGLVCDVPFDGSIAAARIILESLIPATDIVVQPGDAMRRKRLLVADMDSTMITVECIDELADYAGLKPEVAAITERAMRGELDFAAALHARVALLEGMPEATLAACLVERVKATSGARTLVATMRAHGAWTLLVSGGFTAFAGPVAASLGFDEAIANCLEVRSGVLTGKVSGPVIDAAAKAAGQAQAKERLGLLAGEDMAVGDGANDLMMIEAAGLGVAFRAKPLLAAAADASIVHADLTALLWAQGYTRADWVN